jgi:4-amino-4-deoxy-L-arabinose transferase-like glycosyltransferase
MAGPRAPGRVAHLSAERERLWIVVVLVTVILLSFYRLGAGSLWDQDETKYAQVAREILKTGDPITLHVNSRPWYVHPPLYFWLVAATGRVFGFSELTVRFWSAAASVLAVYATILLGRALFGSRAGVLAGAILAVTFQFLIQSRLAVFDTVLLAWMLLAVYSFVRGYESGRGADYLRFFLFAGLATLTKGPIGLLLPGLVIVPFVTLRRAWHRWREVPWIPGLALYAAVGLSWYGVETWLHGRTFVSIVLGYYGVGRFFGVVEDQAGPWYYYVPILLLGAFPWTAFWPQAARYLVSKARTHDGSLLVLLWCGITLAFFTAARTKLPNYMLSFYPFAAIGVAALWDAALRPESGGGFAGNPVPGGSPPSLQRTGREQPIGLSIWLLVALLAVLFAGISTYLGGLYPGLFRTLRGVLLMPAVALGAGVCLVVILVLLRQRLLAYIALCAAMAVAWIGVLTSVLPIADAQKTMQPLALEIRDALRPGDRIVGYRLSIYSSLIYYTDHPVQWVESPTDLHREMCAPGRVFLVITKQGEVSAGGALPPGAQPFAERSGTEVLLKPATISCPTDSHGPSVVGAADRTKIQEFTASKLFFLATGRRPP